ncbi:MOSC domain-containing protein [Natronosalvus amylolyticus]|uniref:MOSC domain-containing protein n=1 Tax=Natronosalvus amylolyticus TaxID=2961994 RepID=UPI0020C98E0F|nr:MOSC domain-containing protein [Natronosalvus amylolyticus]
MSTGNVEAVFLSPESGEPMESIERGEVIESKGIRGDRYFKKEGLWNLLDQDPDRDTKGASDITFIESEALEAVERDAGISIGEGAHRRNVRTRDVPLNHLVGRRFTVGEITCEGIELCEPCGYMQSLIGEDGLSDALVHRGGLNARVVSSGTISVGDEIQW